MRLNTGTALSAFTLAACVAYATPADATIITVHASGAIGGFPTGTGTTATVIPPSGGAYFGIGGAMNGAHADFVWTIDTAQLGASSGAFGPNSAEWAYHDPLLASLDPFITSGSPIGISGTVTVNGISLLAGVDRQVLLLQQDALNQFILRSDTWQAAVVNRDYVDLDIVNNIAFLTSLNPLDLVGLTQSDFCTADASAFARLNRYEGSSATPRNTFGSVDLCARGSTFSVTATETPEPSMLALLATALLALLGFGARVQTRRE